MGVTRQKFSREFKLEAVRQLKAGRRLAVPTKRGKRWHASTVRAVVKRGIGIATF